MGSDPRSKLPADFYDQEPIVAGLGGYEFGPFFLTVRGLTTWSQQTLGGVIGLEQSQISAIERGDSHLRDIELIAGVAHGLQIPPARLNFPDIRVTVGVEGGAGQKVVSWVERRDFGQHIAAAVLGIAGAAGLDLDRLVALLPQAEPTGTRHVGIADVEFIEQLTTAFVRQDFARGSGLIREAAVAHVHTVLPLLDAQIPAELRPRLTLAIAHLAAQTGWMSHDVQHHDAARRLWMIALDLARAAEHPLSADLTVEVLCRMASQALHLGRPDEALHLTRIGHSAASGRQPVSATTGTYLASNAAWAYAHQGDPADCERALGQAADRFSTADTPSVPAPWVVSMDGSELAAHRGHAYYRLALTNWDASVAARAVPLLGDFVDTLPPGHTRTRALNLADLTGAHALAGDADTAVTLGHQAVDAVTAVSSPRAYDRLRTLHTVLEPLHTSPGVADLRDRLATTAA